MIRTIAAALSAASLAAAFLIASPALAAPAPQSVHVPLAGKSAAQVHADIVRAASTVCYTETQHEPLFAYVYPACISQTVSKAVAQIGDPKLADYSRSHAVAYAGR